MLYKLYYDRDPSGLVARKLRKNMYIVKLLSRVRLFATLWTVAHQAPLSMGFSRQEYWTGLPFPTPECLPDPGIETATFGSPALAGKFFTTSTTAPLEN